MRRSVSTFIISLLLAGIILNFSCLSKSRAATNCSIQTNIPQTECECLISFYNATDGPNWDDSPDNNWNQDNDLINWTDLTISGGHVTEIDRRSVSLTGTLPDLSDLPQLQVLSLGTNTLTGSIPDLSNLTNLQELLLPNNQLTGTLPDLSDLTRLEAIRLDNNQFTGAIPDNLDGLSRLETLRLDRNQLTGTIPDNLNALTHLEYLQLFDNQLTGDVPDLSELTRLKVLNLSENQLTGTVPPVLNKLTLLESLSLSDNHLSGYIPDLTTLFSLQELNLSDNRFSGTFPDLTGLINLQELWLQNNQLSGDIPLSFSKLANLSDDKLDIDYNKLTASDAEVISFLALKAPGWAETQTVPPENINAALLSGDSVKITWTPISYTDDSGYYRVRYARESGGPYTEAGVTDDKTADQYEINGLSPGTYYFVVETYTPAHDNQQNNLTSDISSEAETHVTGFPEINVKADTTDISDGSSFDFGSASLGTPISVIFTVENNGDTDLILTEPITLPRGFTLLSSFDSTTVSPASSAVFEVQLNDVLDSPGGELSFENSDRDENPYHFTISGTVNPAPEAEIEVSEGSVTIPDGGRVQFGTTIVGAPVTKTFTITNKGTDALTLNNFQLPSGFSLTDAFPDSIAAGGTENFQIQLDASGEGVFSGELEFENNDSDETPYNFTISGTVNPKPVPEIGITSGNVSVPDGGSIEFGVTEMGAPVVKMFTVSNTGTAALTLSPPELPTGFSLLGAFPDNVAAGGTDSFQVQMDASADGEFKGLLRFGTNDSDENPYVFTLSGTVHTEPEIEVSENGTGIPDGGSVIFGSTLPGQPVLKTFTISNTGKAVLMLSNFTLPNGFDLAGTFPDNIAAGNTGTFQVQLSAETDGTFSGTLEFETNDSDENPYDFTISGTVNPEPAPEIEISDEDDDIPNFGNVHFGNTTLGKPVVKTFSIRNSGTAVLTLGNPEFPTGFSLAGTFPGTIAANATSSFGVQLNGDAEGEFSGTVRFETNDRDENPYNVTLSGTVKPAPEPEIRVSDENRDKVPDGGKVQFNDTFVGTPVIKTFTVRNKGTDSLKLRDLEIPEGFSLVGAFPGKIKPGDTDTFQIQLDAVRIGEFSGKLRFDNNDSDESPYNFTLSGTVNVIPKPEIEVLSDSATIPDGGSVTFSSTTVGIPVIKRFTIKNTGSAELLLSHPELPDGFDLFGVFPRNIAAGASSDFQIRLDAAADGEFKGILRFENNDADENPYSFTLSSMVHPKPEPEIEVRDDTGHIPDDGTADFYNTLVSIPITKTFTVSNTGTADLILGHPELSEGFMLLGDFPETIAKGETDSFEIQLSADVVGIFTGTLRFDNNDADENPYNFILTAEVYPEPKPEIEVSHDGTDIPNDGTVSFGTTTVGTPVTKIFTIRNTGTDVLILSDPELPEGFGLLGEFPENIAMEGTARFEVQFDASSDGISEGMFRFETSDSDENPYVLTLTAEASPEPEPEIEVSHDGTDIPNGGAVSFKSTTVGSPLTKIFTIRNTGMAELNIGAISLPEGFTLKGVLPANIATGGTDSFEVQLDASAIGEFSGILWFDNDDSDEAPYSFTISGTVHPEPEPEIEVSEENTDIPKHGHVNFGDTLVGTPVIKNFSIRNTGDAVLNLSNLEFPNGFSLIGDFPEDVAAGEADSFQIQLDAGNDGAFEGVLLFNTNDSDNDPYEFTIHGVVTALPVADNRPVITGQYPLSTSEETALTITLNDLTVTDPDNVYPDDFTLTVREGENYRLNHSVADVQLTLVMVTGDVDGDGDADLIVGNYGQTNRIYLNNGTTDPFRGVSGLDISTDKHRTRSLVLSDVDGDGDLDLIAGNNNETNQLYLNNGTSNPFRYVKGLDITADTDHTYSVVTGDVDGDGDADLIAGNKGETNRLYLNNGTRNPFSNAAGLDITTDRNHTVSAILEDIDGDGDLDLIAGNDGETNRLYLNNGTTEPFKDIIGTDISTDTDHTRALILGDVDGDGDADMIAGNDGETNRLYLNNGTSDPFSNAAGTDVTTDVSHTASLFLDDVDGDGDPDLIVGNDGEINRVCLNNGTRVPFYSPAMDISADIHHTRSVLLADMDGDGDADLMTGNYGEPNRLYFNNGTREPFNAAGVNIMRDEYHTLSLAMGDIDGDGDPDLAAGRDNGQRNLIYLNKGLRSGLFDEDLRSVENPPDDGDTLCLVLGDADNDGDADMITGNHGANRLYLSNGTSDPFRNTAGMNISTDIHQTRSAALGDIDGDGDSDLVAGNYGDPNRLYLNNGTDNPFHGITGTDITSDSHHTRSVVLGDVDGDGDLDMIAGNDGETNRLYLNNGTTEPFDNVTGMEITRDVHHTYSVALGDVDGDGDLDLIAGNDGETNCVYLNNGTSEPFKQVIGADITKDSDHTRSVALEDVDGDGDLDVIAGNDGERNRVYLNNGTSEPFKDVMAADIMRDAHHTRSVVLGDVDGDGDADIIAGNHGEGNRVYLNNGLGKFFAETAGTEIDNLPDNTIIPATDFNGRLSIPVKVNDGINDSDVFYLDVRVEKVNDPPVITGQTFLYVPEGTSLPITANDLTVTDPDNVFPDDFTLKVSDGENYTFSHTSPFQSRQKEIIITPGDGFSGMLRIPLMVNDSRNDSNLFHLNVMVTSENHPPVITGQTPLSTSTGVSLTITLEDLAVTDPDNVFPDDFTLMVQEGENYTVSENVISPADDFTGMLTVPVMVSDGTSDSNLFLADVEVRENHVPVITGQNPLSTEEETPLTITPADVVVTDPDNVFPDDFTLTVLDGENYDRSENTITPVPGFSDTLTVPLTVNDGTDESDVFYLSVIVSSDADGDGMPDTWESEFGLNPFFDDADQDLDGDGYSNLQEYLYGTNPDDISSAPQPPTANAGDDQTVDEGLTVILNSSDTTDPKNLISEYRWIQTEGIPVTLSDENAPNPTFVTPPVADGSQIVLTFQLMITDRAGFETTDEITVRINDNGITDFSDDVLAFKSATGENMGIKVLSGGDLISLYVISSDMIPETEDKPENLIYSLIDMQVKCFAENDTALLEIYLPASVSDHYKMYQYRSAGGWSDIVANALFNESGDQISLTLTDGGAVDEDGIVNGVIAAIYGPGTPPESGSDGGGGGCFIATATYGHDSCFADRGVQFLLLLVLATVFALFSYRKL
ncbi:choice-of-anchor D domain-containing protein [Desulfonema magnum]|uniref:Leucine-rich repeat domain-containing protein, DUF1573 n=1 Tax=Desulfonema magnum TaxID=45655 RepID=A0A975BMY0_9BACT|nr:choice-of-anchor D domain-containing protein [Desulfonema magnum]QTA88232.1 Leucine-rich repeat domain-containing protein, DUF1573 [Desulfonema magnum]